jgi:hypothetical protein
MSTPTPWNPVQRALFRIACAFYALLLLPWPLDELPVVGDWLGGAYHRRWLDLVTWVAAHVLKIGEVTPSRGGSGDDAYGWTSLLCTIFLALAVALVWTLLDRRTEHRKLHAWLRIWIRYWLAFIMFSYGIIKVFHEQMPPPSPGTLVEPYGEASPMGLLWTFMGASGPYEFFAGAAECLGAVLLCFRRTTTVGALVTSAVLTNVVLLNFCYDVPVKIFSSTLLVSAVFLALPDLGRLFDLLVRNRATAPVDLRPPWSSRWMTIAGWIASVGAVLYVGVTNVSYGLQSQRELDEMRRDDAAYEVESYYELDTMSRGTDQRRWRRVVFEMGYVGIVAGSGAARGFRKVEGSAEPQTITLQRIFKGRAVGAPVAFAWIPGDAGRVVVLGRYFDTSVLVTLHRVDTSQSLLITRGFNLINDGMNR